MISKPCPFKGLNIRMPNTTPLKGSGFIYQRSGLGKCMMVMEDKLDPTYVE